MDFRLIFCILRLRFRGLSALSQYRLRISCSATELHRLVEKLRARAPQILPHALTLCRSRRGRRRQSPNGQSPAAAGAPVSSCRPLPVATCPARYGNAVGLRALVLASLVVGALGCATPAERFAKRADTLGFARTVVQGDPFAHLVLRRGATAGDLLHVYLDGDGSPMLAGVPSPIRPRVSHSSSSSWGSTRSRASTWAGRATTACGRGLPRSGVDVSAVLRGGRGEPRDGRASSRPARRRAARRVDRPQRWWRARSPGRSARSRDRGAGHHRREPLARPLDDRRRHGAPRWLARPVAAPPLPAHAYERHYVGSRDAIVPPAVVMAGAAPATVVVVEGYDHVCCWRVRWPSMLTDLEAHLAAPRLAEGEDLALANFVLIAWSHQA